MYFWPGYRGIVTYGHPSFLVIAIIFAFIVDLFLVMNFFWTDQISAAQRNILLVSVVVIWFILSSFSHFRMKQFDRMSVGIQEEKFKEMIVHYLRGNWYEAEMLIVSQLKYNPNDVEILLLQATLYRHTERYSEAIQILNKLQLTNNANKWFLEIESEKILNNEAITKINNDILVKE
ncbi:MAG: hypothetical protein LBQ66_04085 [Planctomycetaceae bacterium]|jgi:tetratricopeptide (TPR) repeat protein|nr:hypothetical protein [Planctomycetaceae bacterium]